MATRTFFRRGVPLSLAAGLALSALPAAAEIGVSVNGKPVTFGGTRPVEIGGSVLIPLRAVVESLGAEIKWEAATQTVRGKKGSREFELRIGSRDAMVNGMPKTLNTPAQLMSGATMVPLRFVAEALGAEVGWNAASQQVLITAATEEALDTSRIAGNIVSVRPNDSPATITVKVDGINQTYNVSRDAIILRGASGQRGTPVELDALKAGDPVKLRLAANGATAEVIEATGAAVVASDRVTGEVVAISPNLARPTIRVRTENGTETFDVDTDVIVSRAVGTGRLTRSELKNVLVGDRVTLRTDRSGKVVTQVDAVRESARIPVVNGRISGDVVAINRNANPPTVTIRSGSSESILRIDNDATIFRGIGTSPAVRSELGDVEVGDKVRIRVDDRGEIAQVLEATAVEAVPDKDLRITSVRHDATTGYLRSGAVLKVTVQGTPGAEASFDVGSLARDVRMTETANRPGEYTGSFTVPRGKTVGKAAVIAQLKLGTKTAPLVQSGDLIDVDSEPPTISEMQPENNSRVTSQTPDIYAEISDAGGSGIDPQSVRLRVNGRQVVEGVRVTNRLLLYTPRTALPAGRTTVDLQIKDKAGNVADAAWVFTTQRAVAALQGVTHDAAKPLKAGDVLTVRATGAPGSKATFSVGDIVKDVAMKEVKAGEYVGEYTVRQGAQADRAQVSVSITPPGGAAVRAQATAPVNVLTVAPKTPVITFPGKMLRLGDELVVEGTGTPGSKVLVDVKYEGRAFGALAVDGSFGTQEVTVAADGKWKTEPFEVRLPLGVRRPNLTITAITTDAAGTKSAPATLAVTAR